MTANKLRVDFEPIGKRVEIEQGETLLNAAQSSGIDLAAVCGGMGTCEACRVQIVSGSLSALTTVEEFIFSEYEVQHGMRLACQARVQSACLVNIPPDSLTTPQRLQLEGYQKVCSVDDLHRAVDVTLEEPNLQDLRSDSLRLLQYLESNGVGQSNFRFGVLKSLSDEIRACEWKFRVVFEGNEIIGVLPRDHRPIGLAVDIGTTKVASYLLDLESGDTLAQQSAMNPQIHYGEDVVSRIFYCMEHPNGRSTLQKQIVDTLNGLIMDLCGQTNRVPQEIVSVVVVGNTAMHHLFAGLPVQQLGLMPFIPAVSEPIEIPAETLGLQVGCGANVFMPANIAGYVGADHVSMMLATEAYQAQSNTVAVDVGTNTEISLVSGGRISCCSCASGPAFEGAHIHEGMRAAVGAIERVHIDGGTIQLFTVGGLAPVGICGSGILDAISEMVRAGVVDQRGRLLSEAHNVRGDGRGKEFVLAAADKTGIGRDLSITGHDIQEILLAKAAIRAGIEILLLEAGIDASQIDRFIVAGAFGTYMDLRSAVRIGMFPRLPMERFSQVGNAAGAGARQLLVSNERRRRAEEFAGQMQYVELTSHPQFKKIFMDAMDFRGGATMEIK
ncbi:MAG: ASKHA domain-containing protein [Anaerolineaceae bacterium]|nr:ASKHA domain-containing protein [Anaerolineaceae bacterium]